FDKMMDRKLDIMLEYGLITEKLVEKLRETYKYYVPLKGKEFEGDLEDLIDDHEGTGSGFDIRGDEIDRAFGRMAGELATHPILSQAIVDIEATIIRAEKNVVGQALLDFVKEFPDKELYEISKKVRRRVLDRKDGTVKFVADALAKRAPNVVAVKRDGETYFIHLKDTRLAMAMKNIGSAKHGHFIKFLASVNRIMAKINTTLDPEFVVSNFARDLGTALVHLNEEEANGIAWKAISNLPHALAGIGNAEFKGGTSQWAQYYDEFKADGGKIGFFGYNDVVSIAKQLDAEIARAGGGVKNLTVSQMMKLGRLVESANAVVENGIRLSAYVAARNAGASRLKAAVLARNLTVNFNKKGEWGATMNAFYLFSNASIQGSARMFTALWRSKHVKAMAAMQFTSAFLMSALNQGMGGDDEEDGTPYWEKLPDWIKERNLVVMLPESKGSYIKIPLSYGYNVFNVLGVEAWKMFYLGQKGQLTKEQTGRSALSVADAMVGAFSPFGSARLDSPYGVFRQLVPSIAAPIADTMRNETYYGAPIQPTRSSWDNSPNSERYFNSVSDTSKAVTAWANKMTGGNAYQPGMVDVNPEVVDYIIGSYAGASTKTAGRATNVLYTLLSGADFSEFEANDFTFLRRIYGEQNDHSVSAVFYENIEDISQAKGAWDNLNKEKGFDRSKWRKTHGWKQRLFDDMSDVQKKIRKETDPDRKNKLRKRFNKMYRLAWESQF
ncbi:MAG TPA: LPD38 domain-containing protein, partial [Phycisphaerae bacterium]|nr:LPD38 domain-containing protein [Phycisphaerae bacterium]